VRFLVAAVVAACFAFGVRSHAQNAALATNPQASLVSTTRLRLTGNVDSNSPAVWDLTEGVLRLFVVTSYNGRPSTADGRNLAQFGDAQRLDDPRLWSTPSKILNGGSWYPQVMNSTPANHDSYGWPVACHASRKAAYPVITIISR
jgi:hypothetical protein